MIFILSAIAVAIVCGLATAVIGMRVVVTTNFVDIVQSGRHTISYGKDQPAGNVYYAWPHWMPLIGVQVSRLPMSVFSIRLDNYAAYDKGRVPFLIDILAFFRITDSNVAAQRVSSVQELNKQLEGILQGVCRTILARSEIESILEGRSEFGKMFTEEVDHDLLSWGIQSVKQIELMDIHDGQSSNVIQNIMAKKKSLIEMQSRTEVAANLRNAKVAEIEADQAVAVRAQEKDQAVGVRTAQKEQEVQIAAQRATQAVAEEQRQTATKQMAVQQVQQVRQAEISRDVAVVQADQAKQVAIVKADGEKQQTVIIAEGALAQAQLHAQGIKAEGEARGAAETAVLMAPVNAQTALAKEIGANEGYQQYLVRIRTIEQEQTVGVAQAEALKAADIKVIANSGDVQGGVKSVMELLSSKGGTNVGSFVEALKQIPAGAALLRRLNGDEATAGH
jgi:flotillin